MELSSGRITQNQNARLSQSSQNQRIGSLSAYGRSSHVKMLTEGDIIKGEITDLRNNEVEVTLEDNTRVAAFLEDSPSLSIGDTAAFRIVSLKNGNVYLKALKNADSHVQNETILKALKEAGLSADEKNQALVKALMEQSMPINKSSLLAMRRLLFSHPGTDPETLILMQKNNLLVTETNIRFFQAVAKGTHPLFSELSSLTASIPDRLAEMNPKQLPFLLRELFSLLHPEENSSKETENPVFFLTSKAEQEAMAEAVNSLSSFLSEDDLDFLLSDISKGTIHPASAGPILTNARYASFLFDYENLQKAHPEAEEAGAVEKENPSRLRSFLSALLGSSNAGEASDSEKTGGEDTVDPASSSENPQAGSASNSDAEASKDSLSEKMKDTLPVFSPKEELLLKEQLLSEKLPSTLDLFEHPSIRHIFELFGSVQNENRYLSSVLSKEEQLSLFSDLAKLPFPEEVKKMIQSGSISSAALFSSLNEILEKAPSEDLGQLLKNPVFHSLLTKELNAGLLLNPKQLEQGTLSEYFGHLAQKAGRLDLLFPARAENGSSHSLRETFTVLKEIHDIFQYIELPLRFRDTEKGAGLFVYTKKESLLKNPEMIRALLHLSMDHLGLTDVQITLKENQVQADFFTSTENHALLEKHFAKLQSSLMEKGFLLKASCQKEKEEASILKECISEHADSPKKIRYTFDIRA